MPTESDLIAPARAEQPSDARVMEERIQWQALLTGDLPTLRQHADSPLVARAGNSNQGFFGLALSYRFNW